jgi:hypothetical protein
MPQVTEARPQNHKDANLASRSYLPARMSRLSASKIGIMSSCVCISAFRQYEKFSLVPMLTVIVPDVAL